MTVHTVQCATARVGGWRRVALLLVLAAACARVPPEPSGESAGSPVPGAPRVVDIEPSAPVRMEPVAPADSMPRARPAALLPTHRVVAFYGNPLSQRMGILGALEPAAMMRRLEEQAGEYARADPLHPVVPALHLVAVVAQPVAGSDSLFRLPAPDSVIERVSQWAEDRGWLLILDIQPGRSSIRREVRRLLPWLRRPHVHLALDPEFAMGDDGVPGVRIGSLDADDINDAVDLLARLVEEDSLPPRLLIVHRFTDGMVTRIDRIRDDPRVQVIIDMDGFGTPAQKRDTYRAWIPKSGRPFAGFKLFYEQDRPLMSVADVLALDPVPLLIIYQ